MEYILIFIAAVFVNNVVLAQFLGICPFLGVSKKVETAAGMGAAVTFVLTIATIVTFLVQKYILDKFGLGFMQTISFILIIAALVQMVEIILKKVSPALYQALGVFLPLITTNCCILGVAILVIQKKNIIYWNLLYMQYQQLLICASFSYLCRDKRTVGFDTCSRRYERYPYCADNSRFTGNGVYGILRNRII